MVYRGRAVQNRIAAEREWICQFRRQSQARLRQIAESDMKPARGVFAEMVDPNGVERVD
jgi:hypothetical protein